MAVGVPSGGGAETGVEADEDGDEVGSEGIGEEVGEVGVFAWGGVGGGWAFLFGRGGGGG